MKSIYIVPQTDIETLLLRGSVLQQEGDPGYDGPSNTAVTPSANTITFEEDITDSYVGSQSRSLWDE